MAQVQVCRTCLTVIEASAHFVSLDASNPSPSITEIKSKLEACVPEMTVDNVQTPGICSPCLISLDAAYEFKKKCLRTEETIYEYMMDCDNELIDLGILVTRAMKSASAPVIIKTEPGLEMDSQYTPNNHSEDKVALPTPNDHSGDKVALATPNDHSGGKVADATPNNLTDKDAFPVQIKTEPVEVAAEKEHYERVYSIETNGLIQPKLEVMDIGEVPNVSEVYEMPAVRPCSVTLSRLPEEQVKILEHSSIALAVDEADVDVDSIEVEQAPIDTVSVRGSSEVYPTNAQQSKCCVCKIFFKTKEDLKKHSLVHTRNGMKVSLIGYPFSATILEPMRMELYKRKGIKERRYRCGICNLNVECSLEAHLRVHTGEKPYQCILCEFCASRADKLQGHMQAHSQITNNHMLERQYRCNSCKFCTVDRTGLKNHMESHKNDATIPKGFTETYNCVTCRFSTISKDKLMEHLKVAPTGNNGTNNHFQTPNRITVRSPKPVNKFTIKNSIKVPTKPVKPYKCGMCKFATAHKAAYKSHWKTHKKKPTCKCAYCEFKCNTTSELAEHANNHPDAKFYKCGNCDFITDRLARLDCHIPIHGDELSYRCFFCHYRTYVRKYYSDHTRVVHASASVFYNRKMAYPPKADKVL